MPTNILLIRHGATDANSRKPYILQGRGINTELNELGRRQAQALGQYYANHQIDAVYCSPLQRAQETAAAIATPHGLIATQVENFIEADVGAWEALTMDEIKSRWPAEYRLFEDNPTDQGYLGGESFTQVADRTEPVVRELAAKHPNQTVVIIAHNTVNRAIICRCTGVPLQFTRKIPQSNTGVNVLRVDDAGHVKVISINNLSHLTDPELIT